MRGGCLPSLCIRLWGPNGPTRRAPHRQRTRTHQLMAQCLSRRPMLSFEESHVVGCAATLSTCKAAKLSNFVANARLDETIQITACTTVSAEALKGFTSETSAIAADRAMVAAEVKGNSAAVCSASFENVSARAKERCLEAWTRSMVEQVRSAASRTRLTTAAPAAVAATALWLKGRESGQKASNNVGATASRQARRQLRQRTPEVLSSSTSKGIVGTRVTS
mmetsp:Transcript_165782/g.532350  ORF Transcript_165782/g.532350 Transcript_165782/m.532350 type:complete len:222 (+) Transcript_165782:70-735(+)